MDPLIITASCGFARPPQEPLRPDTIEETILSVVEAHAAGAAIAQIRAPLVLDSATGQARSSMGAWVAICAGIRERCDIILQVGVAGMPYAERCALLDAVRPELSSLLVTHHDIIVRGQEIYRLMPRKEAELTLRAHVARGVVPAFEIFHTGCLWAMRRLLEDVPVPGPHQLTLFFWEGGLWSPPSVRELLHRLDDMPSDAQLTVATAHGPEHLAMHALAIGRGAHVRVGFGDHYPCFNEITPELGNAQCVARIRRLAAEMERDVATPTVARRMLRLA